MRGHEFLEIYAQRYAGNPLKSMTKVIIISSSEHPEDKALRDSYDFVLDYLVKPCTKDKLIGLFNRVGELGRPLHVLYDLRIYMSILSGGCFDFGCYRVLLRQPTLAKMGQTQNGGSS